MKNVNKTLPQSHVGTNHIENPQMYLEPKFGGT